jgi:hypothetical protein
VNKPSGLAGPFKTTTIRLASTTEDDDELNMPTEDDEVEVGDDLKFLSEVNESLVRSLPTFSHTVFTPLTPTQVSISSMTTSSTSGASSRPRHGVQSLPQHVQRSFSESFAPCIIAEMGRSSSPWSRLDIDAVQACVNLTYPGREYAVEHGDAFDASVRLRPSNIRSNTNPT